MKGQYHRIEEDLGREGLKTPTFVKHLDLDLSRGLAAFLKQRAAFERYLEERGE